MKMFNYAQPKIYRKIFQPGKLSELVAEIYSGKERKEYKGLTIDEFAKVPTLYSVLDPRTLSILDLEDEKEYTTVNGDVVLGKDIKAFTMLMYDRPRTAYIEFGRLKQVHESLYSGAVPYPMLGFKRFGKITYESWRKKWADQAYLDDELKIVDKEGALEKAFRIDILLGNTFASTKYDASTDSIVWNDKGFGLLLLSTKQGKGYRPDAYTLDYLRTKNMGNYKGNFATTYGTATVPKSSDDKLDNDLISLHNAATTPMRLLMTQRWAWYGNHRCTDMICDFQDWNLMPTKYDTVTNAFTGLKPHQGDKLTGIGSHFGIGKA